MKKFLLLRTNSSKYPEKTTVDADGFEVDDLGVYFYKNAGMADKCERMAYYPRHLVLAVEEVRETKPEQEA